MNQQEEEWLKDLIKKYDIVEEVEQLKEIVMEGKKESEEKAEEEKEEAEKQNTDREELFITAKEQYTELKEKYERLRSEYINRFFNGSEEEKTLGFERKKQVTLESLLSKRGE